MCNMRFIRSSHMNGLVRYSVTPTSLEHEMRDIALYPVSMITGAMLFGDMLERLICVTISMPLVGSICQSVITISGFSRQNIKNPSSPFDALEIFLTPNVSKIALISWSIGAVSSTTKIFNFSKSKAISH